MRCANCGAGISPTKMRSCSFRGFSRTTSCAAGSSPSLRAGRSRDCWRVSASSPRPGARTAPTRRCCGPATGRPAWCRRTGGRGSPRAASTPSTRFAQPCVRRWPPGPSRATPRVHRTANILAPAASSCSSSTAWFRAPARPRWNRRRPRARNASNSWCGDSSRVCTTREHSAGATSRMRISSSAMSASTARPGTLPASRC